MLGKLLKYEFKSFSRLLGLVRLILMFYTSMAIGGSARKNKLFLSIVTFIVIVIIINVIGSLINQGIMDHLPGYSYEITGSEYLAATDGTESVYTLIDTGYYVRQIIFNAIYSVIFLAVSTFFLRRKLNLE